MFIFFFSSPFIFGLESGKIYANFSGEIVTSSSVLDHWDTRNIRHQIVWPTANFRPHLGPRNFRPQIISPTPHKHISTPVPKVKGVPPWGFHIIVVRSHDDRQTLYCFFIVIIITETVVLKEEKFELTNCSFLYS